MERGFRHPQGMYLGREAGPWFTGADVPHENNGAGRPFPQYSPDYQGPWRGHGPPVPHWGHPNLQWDQLNPWQGQDHQNFQCYPAPQHHPEFQSWNHGCGFDNGNFLHRGSHSYRRHSHHKFDGKCSNRFYKGKDSSHNSSRVLVQMQNKKENGSEVKEDESAIPKEAKQAQEDSVALVKNTDPPQNKKENDSEVKEDESAIPKEAKQAQEDSVALVKNTDPPQVSQEASKAIVSPSQFSFCLPPDSLTRRPCSPAKTEDTELIKLCTGSKTEDSHQVACCTQAATSELPSTLENLELKKEEEETELDKLKGTQAQPSQAALLPSAKAHVEGQAPSNSSGTCHSVVKEESMLWNSTASHPVRPLKSIASLASAEAPTETIKDSHPVVKEEPVPETGQDMIIASSTDLSSVIEPSAPSYVIEPPAPLETREAILSLGREEDELLESSQPTDHFNHVDSPPAVEIPFLSDITVECQSEGKEDLELTQMGGSYEDTDSSQACDAVAGGSSAIPVIPSDVHSVPVLVSGKETEQPYFWESESSLHAHNFNWSDDGKGWAHEDYQEPSWGVDKTKKCGSVSELERDLVLSCSSFHSRCSCDRIPDTGRVLECRSSSPKNQNSDSKHSSTQRTMKRLRSPLRQGHHSTSPLRQRWHSRSPRRRGCSHSQDSRRSSGGREITRTDYCSKCHCKCGQNPSRERFQERELPHSYSTHKMHRYHPSKETSKCYGTSHSCSPENSVMTRKRKSKHREETGKGRLTKVKQTKSSKVSKNGRKGRASANCAAALAVETSIPAETTEHFEPANTELYELVQLAPSSEDTGFPHQPFTGKETGTSAPSKIVKDPRSMAVLTRMNQIEQDYLQVMLNFAVVATMLLQKEPCMEQALEVALRANMRSVGDYYDSMLKNFIDDYDFLNTC